MRIKKENITFFILIVVMLCIAYAMYIIKEKAGKDFATYSVSTKVSEEFLLYSNLAYILPMIILTFGWIQFKRGKNNKIHTIMWVELMILLAMVVVISSNYHQCRSKLTEATTDDPTELSAQSIPLTYCPNVTGKAMTSDFAERADIFIANYAIGIFLLYLLPLTWEQIAVARVLLLVVLFGTDTFASENVLLKVVPVIVGILGGCLLYFTIYKNWAKGDKMMKILFSFGLIFSLGGCMLFQFFQSPYWLTHGMWHLCGGMAISFLILGYMNIK